MTDFSPNLQLPYLLSSQNQKHLILNESLLKLDNLVMMKIISNIITSPPAMPNEGDKYIIPSSANGEWQNKTNMIAIFNNSSWDYIDPNDGFLAYLESEKQYISFFDNEWKFLPIEISNFQNLPLIGIGTNADINNPISAKINNALFSAKYINENGNGEIRYLLNKEDISKTASYIFQNNWSGRAEFGLIGDDNFSIKLSQNGIDWKHALIAKTQIFGSELNTKIGINCTEPINTFHVNSPNNYSAVFISQQLYSQGGGGAGIFTYSNNPPLNSTLRLGFIAAGVRDEINNINYNSGLIEFRSTEAWALGSAHGTSFVISTTANNSAIRFPRIIVEENGNLNPAVDNSYSLGTSSNRFSTIYCATGAINTSDGRDKEIECDFPNNAACSIIDDVNPKLYRWKQGKAYFESEIDQSENHDDLNTKIITKTSSGKRLHAGFIAQELKQSLSNNNLDFAVWGLDNVNDSNSKQWLRPDQLLPIIWSALKETRNEVKLLQSMLINQDNNSLNP